MLTEESILSYLERTASAEPVPGGGSAAALNGALAAALIDTVGGRVLWFGVVAGAPGPPDDPAHAARAAQALARTLFP